MSRLQIKGCAFRGGAYLGNIVKVLEGSEKDGEKEKTERGGNIEPE